MPNAWVAAGCAYRGEFGDQGFPWALQREVCVTLPFLLARRRKLRVQSAHHITISSRSVHRQAQG